MLEPLSRRGRPGGRSPISLGGVAAALLLCGLSPALVAQTTLTGRVHAVDGSDAHVAIEGELAPSVGDSVRLGSRIEGVGDVAVAGRWRVAEVGPGWILARPVADAPNPAPGYWARIFSDRPGPMPEAGADDPGAVLVHHDYASEDDVAVRDGPYCRTGPAPGGFRIRTVAETGNCMWTLYSEGTFGSDVRITARLRLTAGEMTWGYGVRFGADRDGERSTLVLVTGGGSHKLQRRDPDGWRDLTEWARSPAIDTGLGATNEITVEVSGATVRYAVNGIPLAEHVGEVEVEGYLGYYLNDAGNEVVVESLTVERLAGDAGNDLLLLHDDLSDGIGSYHNEVCRSGHERGGYRLLNVSGSGSCYLTLGSVGEVDPYARITLEGVLEAGPPDKGWGLKFATVDRENSDYYVFLIDGNGTARMGRWNGSFTWVTDPVESPARTGTGERNRLAVEVRDEVADLYVNGRWVDTYRAPRPLAGRISLYTYAPGVDVLFDDLKIERLEVVERSGKGGK